MTLEELENSDHDGWVEWPNFEDWPSFPENANSFDWSLSFEEIDKRYGDKVVRPPKKYKRYLTPPPYKQVDPKPKTVSEKRIQVTGGKYVNFMGKDCPLHGFINVGHFTGIKKYQDCYYHSGEKMYVFKADGGLRAYKEEAMKKFIKPFFPDAQDVALSVNTNLATAVILKKETGNEMIQRILAEPEKNFHYE